MLLKECFQSWRALYSAMCVWKTADAHAIKTFPKMQGCKRMYLRLRSKILSFLSWSFFHVVLDRGFGGFELFLCDHFDGLYR